jgi:hypothetical protein
MVIVWLIKVIYLVSLEENLARWIGCVYNIISSLSCFKYVSRATRAALCIITGRYHNSPRREERKPPPYFTMATSSDAFVVIHESNQTLLEQTALRQITNNARDSLFHFDSSDVIIGNSRFKRHWYYVNFITEYTIYII